MSYDTLSIVSLLWLIYTFLFVESDRQLFELLERLRYSRALNDKGVLELTQLWANKSLGIPELLELGNKISAETIPHKNIKKFADKYDSINIYKKIMTGNLFVISLNTMLVLLVNLPDWWDLVTKSHLVSSLLLASMFYVAITHISNVKFVYIKIPPKES